MAINDATSAAKRATVIQLCVDAMPAFWRQRESTLKVDAWTKGTQLERTDLTQRGRTPEGWPYMPRDKTTPEYEDLAERAPAPWGKLIVSSLAQTVFMETARMKGQAEDVELDCVSVLEENNWSARQIPHTRATIGHGLSYVKAIPGESPLTGEDSAVVRPVSALRMAAFYDHLDDEWASYAIEVDDFQVELDGKMLTAVTFYDDTTVQSLWFEGTGEDPGDWIWAGIEQIHSLGVCPIIRFANLMDLEGNTLGEIAPIIPLLRRIDQDTFDRLVVQRFGAWKVRYIAGLAEPTTDAEKRAQKLKLGVEDILVAADADTKFGTLDSTSPKDFIEATDADLRVLAAVTQTPPHHLLGLSSNLQAEALAAAEAGLQRKSLDFQIYNSGSYRQLLRLIAKIRGNKEEATASHLEIRYRDTESRSLVQAAQALGTLATQLKIPVELLWSRVPGWSDDDSERAKVIIEQGGIEQFLSAAAAEQEIATAEAQAAAAPPAQTGDQSSSSQ